VAGARSLPLSIIVRQTWCISKISSLYEVFPELAGNGGAHGVHYAAEKWGHGSAPPFSAPSLFSLRENSGTSSPATEPSRMALSGAGGGLPGSASLGKLIQRSDSEAAFQE